MNYDFDTHPPRRGTFSEKWDLYAEDILPMWVADMDFVSPEPVIRALRQRVEHGIFGYPEETKGWKPVQEAIIEWLARYHNWNVQPEELVFVPGVIVGFHLACHLLSDERPGVLVQTPVYPPIWKAAQTTGKLSQETQLLQSPDGTYVVDWDAFAAAMNEQTGLFILCNPHNPVGRVYRREELERMAQLCLEREVLICSDEIHCDLTYPGYDHLPIASLDAEIARRTITLMSPSKTFNLPGLQLSFAIIQDAELRRRYRQAGKGLISWVNLLARVAALAAYREGQEWLEQLLAYLQGNRAYLDVFLKSEMPELRMALPEATYLAWIDCREAGIPGNPYEFFLEKARLALVDGAAFGRGGEGFVRLNFGCPRATLAEGLDRIKQALNSNRV